MHNTVRYTSDVNLRRKIPCDYLMAQGLLLLTIYSIRVQIETSRKGGWGWGGVSPSTFFTCRHFVGISAKFHRGSSHGKKIKNLWRRKCVRRAIFRTVEVRVESRFVPVNPHIVCNTAIGSLCDDFYKKSYDFSIKNR